jgi:hypothetical protein
MKVYVFVEGDSDRIALNTLWANWRNVLGAAGWGIHMIPLDDKSRFLRKIGHRAAEKLVNDPRDLAVGLPDLYPNHGYENTPYKHANLQDLKRVQTHLVAGALAQKFGLSQGQCDVALKRFFASAFKHDMEVLLLAAKEELRSVLGTPASIRNWRHPVEDQNQVEPPKYIVAELFRTKLRRHYRDTVHARAVLEKVTDIKGLLYTSSRQSQCPVFKEMMDWIGSKTGIAGY